MEDTLTWLHLSDLHLCPERTGWDADRVLRALTRDLAELAADHELRPDLIFFTGDAAFGELPGLPIRDQFAAAGRFFEEIEQLCRVPRENVFLVPGNHDVDRGRVSGPMTEWLDARVRGHKLDEVRELVRQGGRDWHIVMERLEEYRTFLREHGYHHLLDDPDRLIYAARRRARRIDVAIAGLNSAWSCGREEEKGRLWLAADYQVAVLERKLEDAQVVVGLVHHPRGWYVPAEDPEVERTFERVFDFHLHGHEHQAWVKPTADGHVRVAAGASYDRSDHPNGYNLVRLDFESEKAEVWLREYEKDAGAWQQRILKGKTDVHGVWHLDGLRCFERRLRMVSTSDGASTPGGETASQGAMDDSVDVFVSYHPADRAEAQALIASLEQHGLGVWVAGRDEIPGRWRQAEQEAALAAAPATAVLMGASGPDPWTDLHMRAGLTRLVEKDAVVIPVFLPNAPKEAEFPPFLKELVHVDMRDPDHDVEQLVRGIRAARSQGPFVLTRDARDRPLDICGNPPSGMSIDSMSRVPIYGLPPATNTIFLGREEDLDRLHEALKPTRTVALTARVSAHGGGGVGKTRLAFEYAWRYRESFPGGIFWTVVGNREPQAVWAELGRRRFADQEFADDTKAALAFFAALDQCTEPLLVVLDDLSGNPQRFARLLEIGGAKHAAIPTPVHVRVLITTRFSDVAIARPLLVSRLPKTAAVELLLNHARRNNETGATTLAHDDLDGHPLAVALAGTYLRKVRGLSILEYRKRLLDKGLTEGLEVAARHAGCSITDHERSIAATFRLSHNLLDTGAPIDRIAKTMLDLVAFLATGVEFDAQLLCKIVRTTDYQTHEDDAELAAARLADISLFEPGRKVHALVADYVRWGQDKQRQLHHCGTLLKMTNSLFPKDMKKDAWKIFIPGGQDEWQELTVARRQHIAALNHLADKLAERHPKVARPWLYNLAVSHRKIGEVALKQGNLSDAEAELLTSREYLSRLVQRYPKNKMILSCLQGAESSLFSTLQAKGDNSGAQASLQATLNLCMKNPSRKGRRRHKQSRQNLPQRSRPADLDAAEKAQQVAQDNLAAELERIRQDNPEFREPPTIDNAKSFRGIAKSHAQIGTMPHLRLAKDIFLQLVKLDLGNVEWLHDLSALHRKIGDVLQLQGDKAGALGEYSAAQKILQKLSNEIPDYVEWQIDLARTYLSMADVALDDSSLTVFLGNGLQILQRLDKKGQLPPAAQGLRDSFRRRLKNPHREPSRSPLQRLQEKIEGQSNT